MTLYKNSNGYNPMTCGCQSAMRHWEIHSKLKVQNCSIKRCTNKAEVGGHVIKCHGNSLNTKYIIPICKSCNNPKNTDCFEIQAHIPPIEVKLRTYCKNN